MEVTDKNPQPTRLADMIDGLGIIGRLPAGKGQLHYVDYAPVKAKAETESTVFSESFTRSYHGDAEIPEISLKMYVKEIIPREATVMVAPDDPDLDNKLIEQVLGPALKLIDDIAAENATKFFSKESAFLTLNATVDLVGQRRLASRILSFANTIAAKCRRGPAKFIILSRRVYDLLVKDFDDPNKITRARMYSNFCGMDMLITDRFGDQVILGGIDKDGPGIYYHIEDPGLEDFLTEGESIEPSAVNLRYALEQIGSSLPYVKFKVVFDEPVLQTQG